MIRLKEGSGEPSYDELPLEDGIRHSWGLWGSTDRFGCLNRIDGSHVLGAVGAVRRGAVFSLNWDLALPHPALFGRPNLKHEIVLSANGTSLNDVLSDWNTQASSQWDGFRHVTWPDHGTYNGIVDNGVHHWAQRGIVARCVLADVGRWRESIGRPLRFDVPDEISLADLVATLDAQGSSIRHGDILLVRTGWIADYLTESEETRKRWADRDLLVAPGLSANEDVVRWLWDKGVAAVASDNPALEVWPQGFGSDGQKKYSVTLHTRLLPALGMPIGELWDLEGLGRDCAEDRVYEAMLTSAPLHLVGGAATPANAVVVK